jgi:short-subunit dehydrogenase
MNLVITGSSSGSGKFLADLLTAKDQAICRLARSPQDGFSFRRDVSDWPALRATGRKTTLTIEQSIIRTLSWLKENQWVLHKRN